MKNNINKPPQSKKDRLKVLDLLAKISLDQHVIIVAKLVMRKNTVAICMVNQEITIAE